MATIHRPEANGQAISPNIGDAVDQIVQRISKAPRRSKFVKPSGTHNPVETVESARRLRDCCGYLKIPKSAIAAGAGGASRTLAGLLRFANSRSRSCWPSLKTVSDECGLKRWTTQRHIAAMESSGLVRIDRTFGTSTYVIQEDAWPGRSNWLPLPGWWNCATWSTTAVYSWILARSCLMETKEEGGDCCLDDLRLATYAQIRRDLCLTKRSIRTALEDLSTTSVPLIGRSIPTADDRLFEVYLCPTRVQPTKG